MLTAATAWTGWGGRAGLAGALFLFVSATGFVVANSIAKALAGFPGRAGAVSALDGSVHYGLCIRSSESMADLPLAFGLDQSVGSDILLDVRRHGASPVRGR